jgi:hypothetical protein
MSKRREMQRIIRHYKDDTGEREVDMHKVVKWAVAKGWPLPRPADPLELLAKEFTDAARDEIKHDNETGEPYRVYHSITVRHGESQLHLFIDIDEAPRHQMLKSLISRREQMVGDGLQLTLDKEHWNRINLKQDPIDIPMDLTLDIEWRRHAPKDGEEAA